MKKRILSVFLACALLLGCLFAFSSCSKLLGKYVSDVDENCTMTFVGDYAILVQGDDEEEDAYYITIYKYDIDDDEIDLTIQAVLSTDFDLDVQEDIIERNEEIQDNTEEENTMTLSFDKERKTITIGGLSFTKD